MYRCRSIALSLDYPSVVSGHGLWQFEQSAELAVSIIRSVLAEPEADWNECMVNVNFPSALSSFIRGARVVKQGRSRFRNWYTKVEKLDEVEQQQHPDRRRYRLEGEMELSDDPADLDIDTTALKADYVTVTPLFMFLDMSDEQFSLFSRRMSQWPVFDELKRRCALVEP